MFLKCKPDETPLWNNPHSSCLHLCQCAEASLVYDRYHNVNRVKTISGNILYTYKFTVLKPFLAMGGGRGGGCSPKQNFHNSMAHVQTSQSTLVICIVISISFQSVFRRSAAAFHMAISLIRLKCAAATSWRRQRLQLQKVESLAKCATNKYKIKLPMRIRLKRKLLYVLRCCWCCCCYVYRCYLLLIDILFIGFVVASKADGVQGGALLCNAANNVNSMNANINLLLAY